MEDTNLGLPLLTRYQPFLLPLLLLQNSDNMSKSTHFFGQQIYGQLIKALDRDKIVEISRQNGGERYVKHGEPLLFGENNEYELAQEGFGLKVIKLGENGATIDDVLVHDAHAQDDAENAEILWSGFITPNIAVAMLR